MFPNILDAEVIYGKVEPERAGLVFPQTRCVGLFMISVAGEAFLQKLVREDSGLRETVHAFPYFHVGIIVKGFLT